MFDSMPARKNVSHLVHETSRISAEKRLLEADSKGSAITSLTKLGPKAMEGVWRLNGLNVEAGSQSNNPPVYKERRPADP